MSPLKNLSDYNMDSKENIISLPINDSNKRSSVDENIRSQMDVGDDIVPAPSSLFSENESDMKSGNINGLLPKEKVSYPFILFHYIFLFYNLVSEFLTFKLWSKILMCGFFYQNTFGGVG